ncbi:hypothetical protein OIDMADRAFT_145609 [Oidiodendron maius Zn]|uniref:Uncharacterized protein n=1 Tax=Oidiodendron maius (strain Zn) TaxID=913774 RepID=A0A0C3DHV1_OIDMZ|nr:hypothetical protein OIDMADRAFT_145609 [Oidiodendron maius Zn]
MSATYFWRGDYEIPKMTPLKSVVAEQGIHDGFIPAKEKQENFANLATTTVKAENDEIQKSHKDMGSVNVEDRHKIIILERGRVMLAIMDLLLAEAIATNEEPLNESRTTIASVICRTR